MITYPNLSQLLELYDEVTRVSGGAYGLRDLGYLELAIYQPKQTFEGKDLYTSLEEKVAALGFAIIMNHPFIDGNKRMGLAAMDFFLSLKGFFLNTSTDESVETILGVAKGELSKEHLTAWVADHTSPLTS